MKNHAAASKPITFELLGQNQLKLAADRRGPPSGTTVLLLHGGGQTRQSWQNTSAVLAAEGYNTISIDLRGHGESEWAVDGDYSFDTLVGDLESCCLQLGGPAILVGASIGGALSIILASRRPELCRALVLVDVSPTIEIAGAQEIVDFMTAHPNGFGSLEEAQESISGHSPNRQRKASTEGLQRVLRQRADGRWIWHWDPQFIAGEWQLKVQELSDLMQAAAINISQPSLLIRGQLSTIVRMESVQKLQQDIPQLQFVDIAGAGHMVAGDRNDMASKALIDFFKRNPDSTSQHMTPADAIIFIHGGQHDARCWEPTIQQLRKHTNTPLLAVNLPGRNGEPGDLRNLTIETCVNSVTKQISIANLGGRLMLVGHSMAGVSMPAVAEKLGYESLHSMVFISCCIPKEGESILSSLGQPMAAIAKFGARWRPTMAPLPAAIASTVFGNGMNPTQKQFMLATLCRESTLIAQESIYRSNMPECPRHWLMLTKDRALSPARQQSYIDNLGGVNSIITIDSCHDAMIAAPKEIAIALDELALSR